MASDSNQGEEALPETIPVREAHRFDTARLQGLLAQRLGARLAEIRQMRGGQSNPTFLVVTDQDRKSTRLNSSHLVISYAVFCLKKKNTNNYVRTINQEELVTVVIVRGS